MNIQTLMADLRAARRNPLFVMVAVVMMCAIKSTLKILIGTTIHSPMIAGDGFHNVADVLQAAAGVLVLLIARKPANTDYHFGRKNIEFMSSLVIGGALLLTSVNFALQALTGLLSFVPALDKAIRAHVPLPAHEMLIMDAHTFPWVLSITFFSVIASLVVSKWVISVGKEKGHRSLIATGEETASDARVEAVTVVGVLAEYLFHVPLLQNLLGTHVAYFIEYSLGLFVAFLIGHTGLELFNNAIGVLLQKSIGRDHDAKVRQICLNTAGVLDICSLKTFQVGQTAVCLFTIATRANALAVESVKYGIEFHVTKYLLANEFKEAEIHIKVAVPKPLQHRIAYAVVRKGDREFIAPAIAQATHLLICDVIDNVIKRTVWEPKPADPAHFLGQRGKHVVMLYEWEPSSESLSEELSKEGVGLSATSSYLPVNLGLGPAGD